MYKAPIAQENSLTIKTALKKCAKFGRPASTTAIMKGDWDPIDCPPPLMNGWSLGTTQATRSIASEYKVTTRILIFLDPIFILSTLASALLSAAVAAIMSIPVYENSTWIHVVL
jgi:hypothetical protein